MNIDDIKFDQHHIWHPYSSIGKKNLSYLIVEASGVELKLTNGKKLIDGMSSWWASIHGYNHPTLNQAAINQINKMSHVMFGGITHQAAISLCKKLINLTHDQLECVFLSDSGSVAIEIALKMALQYWDAKGENRKKFITLKNGYHGDTFGAMSISDPKNLMHDLYQGYLSSNFFIQSPQCGFYEKWDEEELIPLKKLLSKHYKKIAAFILEPIVQGAGGMRIYHPTYLTKVRELCNQYNILLILDEIATGFGRTGKLFAYEHSSIAPDILCLGKALTGGYITLSSVLTTRKISNVINKSRAGCFMHGPTFMGNPLACSIANENLILIQNIPWKQWIKNIETQLITELLPLKKDPKVSDVRILGAIGIVEMKKNFDLYKIQHFFIQEGVWIRPFKKLIYIVPPYIITPKQLNKLTKAIKKIINLYIK